MKKMIGVMLFVSVFSLSLAARADQSKMDLLLRSAVERPAESSVLLSKSLKQVGGETLVSCFVKSNDVLATEAAIIDAGGTVNTVLKTILTAQIPMSALEAISNRSEVVVLEADRELKPKMNAARTFTMVDDVQDGINVSQAYNGKNVMVGVVDDALDWRNSDFSGRVLWVQMTSGGSLLTCDKVDIDDGTCNIPSQVGSSANAGHGTHVTGIAAGANGTYKGVAPEAWLGLVTNPTQDADSGGSLATSVVDSVDDLFFVADDQDLPAVVNLSLGTSLGAHDDTSLLEEGLNELINLNPNGRLIVNAAGNENVNDNWVDGYIEPGLSALIGGIHAGINVTADTAWRFGVWQGTPVVVDVWLDQGSAANCTIDVKAYSYNTANRNNILPPSAPNANTGDAVVSTGVVDFNDQSPTPVQDPSQLIKISVQTEDAYVQNNKARALVQVLAGDSGSVANIDDYAYDVIIRPTSGTCSGDVWLYPDFVLANDFLDNVAGLAVDVGAMGAGYVYADGDSQKTTTIPGTASGLITVGSFMDRPTWVDIDGVTRNQTPFDSSIGNTGGTSGQVSLFSSLGPTADGRPKPEVVAPGEPILSTLADGYSPPRFNMGDSNHHKLEGTSMASPHVAGIIALMLEKNNCLTTQQVRTLLANNSSDSTLTISYTANPLNTYGYGIPNAVNIFNDSTFGENHSCYSGSGPSKGGGGCFGGSTLVPVTPAASIPALALMFAPLAAIVIRRRVQKKR